MHLDLAARLGGVLTLRGFTRVRAGAQRWDDGVFITRGVVVGWAHPKHRPDTSSVSSPAREGTACMRLVQ